ncbi:hypothetical protein BDZ89DRAFT_488285 [Hymenopellis radicata]|nr:hypothetical protein BDZ89DRAFT_488285 [Hymenopellis radicata]
MTFPLPRSTENLAFLSGRGLEDVWRFSCGALVRAAQRSCRRGECMSDGFLFVRGYLRFALCQPRDCGKYTTSECPRFVLPLSVVPSWTPHSISGLRLFYYLTLAIGMDAACTPLVLVLFGPGKTRLM